MRMNKQKIIEISNPVNIFETENLFILTEKKIKNKMNGSFGSLWIPMDIWKWLRITNIQISLSHIILIYTQISVFHQNFNISICPSTFVTQCEMATTATTMNPTVGYLCIVKRLKCEQTTT